jgi:hypothetical protein
MGCHHQFPSCLVSDLRDPLPWSRLADTTPACSDGVLQPWSQLGWWRWMYRLSPYTYIIEVGARGNRDELRTLIL